MNTEERLTNLEARIAVLEDELQSLKKEVALIKGNEEVESTTENTILCMSIRDMCLGYRSWNRLQRAGINTVGELVALLGEELRAIQNLGEEDYDKIMEKILDLFNSVVKMQKENIKKKQVLKSEMAKKLFPAIKLYVKIRTKAEEEGIMFRVLGRYGKFTKWYRIGIRNREEGDYSFISDGFLDSTLKGKYPKMKELLDAETVNLDLAKAAIIEDVAEGSRCLNRQTKTYKELLRFLQVIQEYNES